MPRHTVRVAASAADVYSLLAHARRRPEWLPELVDTDAPDRPLEAGDRFYGYAKLLGHRFVGASEVVGAARDEELAERVVIGARFTTRWTVAPVAGGVAVTHSLDVDFPGGALGRVERWLLARRLARLQRQGLRRLVARVEGA